MDNTAKPESKNGWLVYGALGGAALLIYSGVAGGPTCEVTGLRAYGDAFYDNGLDYGIVVVANVQNTGNGGPVNIEGAIRTSEGDFGKVRRYTLDKGQSVSVEFQFLEPTIGVDTNNLRPSVRCVDS